MSGSPSLASTAVRGAVWTVGLSLGSKVIGVTGTLIIARFIKPDVYGEVLAAMYIAMLAHSITRFGLDQYLIVKSEPGDEIAFHATLWLTVLGALGFGVALAAGGLFGPWLNAEHIERYLPGMVLAIAIRRVAMIPDRILIRDLRFRPVAMANAFGEVVYMASAVTLAMYGWGGDAVVIGNVIQSIATAVALTMAAGAREWLVPVRIRWQRTRDMLRFGAPLTVDTAAGVGSRMVDNLMYSHYFGTGVMALYNQGYNLADIPATHIGEHISSVLLPSINKVAPAHRARALVRSTALLSLLVFPMAVGLGAVSDSLISVALPDDEWQGVAPLLTVLSVLSVVRPVSWVIGSYMKVADRTSVLMWLSLVQIAALIGCIAALHRYGPEVTAVSVGIAFGAHALILVVLACRMEDIPVGRFVAGFAGPLLACAPMVVAVLGVRRGLALAGVDSAGLSLICEIAAGALVYVPAALVLARGTARDFLDLLRKTYARRQS